MYHLVNWLAGLTVGDYGSINVPSAAPFVCTLSVQQLKLVLRVGGVDPAWYTEKEELVAKVCQMLLFTIEGG